MSLDAVGQDQFKPLINRRAGYGSAEDKTQRVIEWLTRHPGATLASGEGDLLLQRIRELEAQLESLRPKPAVLPELETSVYPEDHHVAS